MLYSTANLADASGHATVVPERKEKQIWSGNRHVLDQTVLLRAVIQCVLADGRFDCL